jgi:hypothetical protein
VRADISEACQNAGGCGGAVTTAPALPTGKYSEILDIDANGFIHASMKNVAPTSAKVMGMDFLLAPTLTPAGASVTWSCGTAGVVGQGPGSPNTTVTRTVTGTGTLGALSGKFMPKSCTL